MEKLTLPKGFNSWFEVYISLKKSGHDQETQVCFEQPRPFERHSYYYVNDIKVRALEEIMEALPSFHTLDIIGRMLHSHEAKNMGRDTAADLEKLTELLLLKDLIMND